MQIMTKSNEAAIASIIILIAYSAVAPAKIILDGGSPLEICCHVANMLFLADAAIIAFLHKLGSRYAWHHAIACWASLALYGFSMTTQIVLAHRNSSYLILLFFGINFVVWIVIVAMQCCMTTAVAAPSSSAHLYCDVQVQQPFLPLDLPGRIWIVFALSILFLILYIGAAFTDDSIAGATLSAILCIMLAMLAGSSWIVASAPLIADDIATPLAPQEDTAAKINVGDMA